MSCTSSMIFNLSLKCQHGAVWKNLKVLKLSILHMLCVLEIIKENVYLSS